MRLSLPLTAIVLAAAHLAGAVPAARFAHAEDAVSGAEQAKKESIERLEKDLRRLANSPRVEQKKDEILKTLESLAVLGGVPAGKASLAALAFDNEEVEKAVM